MSLGRQKKYSKEQQTFIVLTCSEQIHSRERYTLMECVKVWIIAVADE